MKILWVGPVVSESEVDKSAAISPAANDWQLAMIRGLIENGAEVSVISYFPQPVWPRGELFISSAQVNSSSLELRFIDYINVMFLREYMLGLRFKSELKKILAEDIIPDAIITYNPSKMNCVIGEMFQVQYGGQWISIVADGYSKGNPDKEIYLSYGYFRRSNKSKKLHIDGATGPFRETLNLSNGNRIMIFSGTLDKWTGIEEFALQFSRLDAKDIELHIYGKGDAQVLQSIAEKCPSIKVKGFVSSKELTKACENAYAFVNPRPTHLPVIENNFPSKLLHYLTFGKPILSSKTAGIAPLYDDLLYFYDPLDMDSLEKAFEKIAGLSEEEISQIKNSAKRFCDRHTWKSQALRVIKFVREKDTVIA